MSYLPPLLLLAAVIFVNGWTDAPNAIVTPVASGILSFKAAVLLAAVCNLFGVLSAATVSDAVARTLYSIADFGPHSLSALTAALSATALWGVFAWRFGIPTSESHGLIAGLIGSALALGNDCIRLLTLRTVLIGAILSLLLGFGFGRLLKSILPKNSPLYSVGQIFGAAATSYLHGAQDGQKFLGILALILSLRHQGYALHPWEYLVCALLMSLGTLCGGRRIIENIGRKMVLLTPQAGFAAEIGCDLTLALCTAFGLPVSTTHAKTAAVLGAGTAPDRTVAGELAIAWLLTFPACGALAFGITRMMLIKIV